MTDQHIPVFYMQVDLFHRRVHPQRVVVLCSLYSFAFSIKLRNNRTREINQLPLLSVFEEDIF